MHLSLLPACLLGFHFCKEPVLGQKQTEFRPGTGSGSSFSRECTNTLLCCCPLRKAASKESCHGKEFLIYSLQYQAHIYHRVTPECNILTLYIFNPAYINKCIALGKINCSFPIKYHGGKIFVVKILTNFFCCLVSLITFLR